MGLLPLMAVVLTSMTMPTVSYTEDSVYKKDCVSMSVVLEEDGSKTLLIEEKNLLGYCIYDDLDTPYIDGLRFNEEYVYNWQVANYDENVEHTLYIRTVYTDDIAGMLAAAKDGDYLKVLANPLMIIQLGYYALAALSIILGGFGLLKAKKSKIKDHNQIANAVNTAAKNTMDNIEKLAGALIENIFIPVLTQVQEQNNGMLEALILSRNDDAESKIAMIDMIKKSAKGFDPTKLAEETKARVIKAMEEARKIKDDALVDVKKIATGDFEDKGDDGSSGSNYGGIAV